MDIIDALHWSMDYIGQLITWVDVLQWSMDIIDALHWSMDYIGQLITLVDG